MSQGAVSRELSRNSGQRGYRFAQAQRTAQPRHAQDRHKSCNLKLRERRAIARKLRMIRDDERAGGDLWHFCDAVARNITGVGHSAPAAA